MRQQYSTLDLAATQALPVDNSDHEGSGIPLWVHPHDGVVEVRTSREARDAARFTTNEEAGAVFRLILLLSVATDRDTWDSMLAEVCPVHELRSRVDQLLVGFYEHNRRSLGLVA